MPQVPYSPVPTERPSQQAIPGFSVPTPGAAFGENVAQAVQGLGSAVEGAGNELFSRAVALQQLANETEAKEADAKYMIGAGELHAQYSALSGQDAVQAYPKYAKDLQELRQKMRGDLSNDMARRMYDSSSLSTMGRSIFNGAGHAATENKHWAISTATAQIDLDAKTVEDNPNDEGLFQAKLQRVKQNVSTLSSLKGFDAGGPQEQDLALKATSRLWAQRIIGMSRVAPFEAANFLDKHKTELTQDDFLKVDNTVRSQGRAVGSVNIANEVYNANRGDDAKPGKSLKEMEDLARAKAEAFNKDDLLLAQHAVTALRGIYNQDKYASRQEEIANEQTVNEAIRAGVKNEQDLRANPKVAAAIDALPAAKRLGIPGAINRYNAARDKQTVEENYFQLKGLANNDVEAFLNTDVTKEKLSKADMDKLMGLQQKLKANASADPRVNRAIGQIRGAMASQLEALGIFRRTEGNKEDYDHFTGAVQSALDVWQETHGKPPTYKDVVEQIGPQVLKQRDEPGWLWGTNRKSFFQQTVPPDFKERLVVDVKSQGGVEPTEEQIYKAYVRSQFIKLYGKKETP